MDGIDREIPKVNQGKIMSLILQISIAWEQQTHPRDSSLEDGRISALERPLNREYEWWAVSSGMIFPRLF